MAWINLFVRVMMCEKGCCGAISLFFQKNPGVVGNKRVEGFKMKVKGGNNSAKMVHLGWAIRPLVPEEVYTDR